MKNEKEPSEPSIEDILSSIRQIVSTESVAPPFSKKQGILADYEDVLDLTHLLSDEKPAVTPDMRSRSSRPLPLQSKERHAQTIEGMVEQILRPMIQEWVNQNLPNLVQELVKRELKAPTKDIRRLN